MLLPADVEIDPVDRDELAKSLDESSRLDGRLSVLAGHGPER